MIKPHKARKRFGQNFLVDQSVIDRIIRSVAAGPHDNLVEIGPGQGALTAQLIEQCPGLHVIELDRDLVPNLLAQFAKHSEFKIHNVDALKFDYRTLATPDNPLRIVGNLPYNISTPLMFHLLSYQDLVVDMHFMLQKEVVQRLCASHGEKHYGRLGIMMQYHCQVDYLFDVPPNAFSPAPKVDSAVVRLRPYASPPIVADNPEHFAGLVNRAFQQRRKTLRNTLKSDIEGIDPNTLPIDLSLRAEAISIDQFVQLSNLLNARPSRCDDTV